VGEVNAIEIRNLSKSFRGMYALDHSVENIFWDLKVLRRTYDLSCAETLLDAKSRSYFTPTIGKKLR
jgi:hypothetical protein